MSQLPISVTRHYSDGSKPVTTFSPSFETGEQVARFQLEKLDCERVIVCDTQSGVRKEFVRESGETINATTGETLEVCPHCNSRIYELLEIIAAKDVELAGQTRTIKQKSGEVNLLREEKKKKAQDEATWEDFMIAFNFWQTNCKHPQSMPDTTRYNLFMTKLKAYGFEKCLMAIAGAAASRERTIKAKGKAYDQWQNIFRNNDNFEMNCNFAPRDWKVIYNVTDELLNVPC